MFSLVISQGWISPFEAQPPTRSTVGSTTSVPPVCSASLACANISSWPGCSVKFTLMPVAASKAGNTVSARPGYPAQPMKFTSPDEASALCEMIAGAASMPTPTADPLRNVRRLKPVFVCFMMSSPLLSVKPDCPQAPPQHPAAWRDRQLAALRNNPVTPGAWAPVPGRHKIGKTVLCQQTAAQVARLLSGKRALPEYPSCQDCGFQPLRALRSAGCRVSD